MALSSTSLRLLSASMLQKSPSALADMRKPKELSPRSHIPHKAQFLYTWKTWDGRTWRAQDVSRRMTLKTKTLRYWQAAARMAKEELQKCKTSERKLLQFRLHYAEARIHVHRMTLPVIEWLVQQDFLALLLCSAPMLRSNAYGKLLDDSMKTSYELRQMVGVWAGHLIYFQQSRYNPLLAKVKRSIFEATQAFHDEGRSIRAEYKALRARIKSFKNSEKHRREGRQKRAIWPQDLRRNEQELRQRSRHLTHDRLERMFQVTAEVLIADSRLWIPEIPNMMLKRYMALMIATMNLLGIVCSMLSKWPATLRYKESVANYRKTQAQRLVGLTKPFSEIESDIRALTNEIHELRCFRVHRHEADHLRDEIRFNQSIAKRICPTVFGNEARLQMAMEHSSIPPPMCPQQDILQGRVRASTEQKRTRQVAAEDERREAPQPYI